MNSIELNRRQAMIASGLGTMSLGMHGSVLGSDKLDESGNAVASEKSCIFVLLCGGPSHVDTWDMKPDAPLDYRGPYAPIETRVPGMMLNEMHTELAKQAEHFTLINSMSHPGAISNHFDAMHNLLSGQSNERVQQGKPNDQPYLGSHVAKHRPSTKTFVSNAWLIKCVGPPVFCAPNIGIGGYLGSGYAPLFVGAADNHPAMPSFKPPQIFDPYDEARLETRKGLLRNLESHRFDKDAQVKDWSDLREKTYDGLTRVEGRQAFELHREPDEVRQKYGMHPLGQNLLLARRMVESGVRFVTVNGWAGQAEHDKKGPPSSSWDMHGGNMGMGNAFGNGSYGMNFCLPRLDQGLAALFADLSDRGMLDNTLVVITGEFGRTPYLMKQSPPGRQHWPRLFSSIIAGCGIKGGNVYGKSNRLGEHPVVNPVRPEQLAATIYHALDIPIRNPLDPIDRPLTDGEPIMDLFG